MKATTTLFATLAILSPLLLLAPTATAQDRVIVVSSASDRSAGLDLSAVGEIFQASNTLQHFEQQLNDPDLLLNNLDLNEDGQADFLRVLEEETDEGRLIIIQAILGENTFTDVAYIDIQQEQNGQYQVQIRGESSLYGSHRYYLPRYRTVDWPIVVNLWSPDYSHYASPYSWGFYPSWYRPYSCVRVGFYRSRIAYRYPKPYFHFSYHAGFSKYYRHPHRSHRSYRDFLGHRDRGYRSDFRRDDRRDRFDRNHRYRPGRPSPEPRMHPSREKSEPSYRILDGEPRQWNPQRTERLRPATERGARPVSPSIRQERMQRSPDNLSPRIQPRERIVPRPIESRQLHPKLPRPGADMNVRPLPRPQPSKPTGWTPPQPSRPTPSFRDGRTPASPGGTLERMRPIERSVPPTDRPSAPPVPGRHKDR